MSEGASVDELDRDEHYQGAVDAELDGRFDEALARYTLVTTTHDDIPLRREARFRRAVCLAELERWEEALEAAASVDAPGRSADVELIVGRANRELSRLDEAAAAYRRSIALRPRAFVYCLLADVEGRRGDFEREAALLEKALELDPDYEEAHYNLGVYAKREGDAGLARSRFERAIEIDPDYPRPHAELGHLFIREGRLDDAERSLARALELDPDLFWARVYLGHVCFRRRRLTEAADHFRRSARQVPTNGLPDSFLGDVLWDQGKLQAAEVSYRRAVEKDGSAVAHHHLGRFLRRTGREEEAEVHLRAAADQGYERAVRLLDSDGED